MFLTLLAVTFLISLGVSWLVVWIFTKPITAILQRIIADNISRAWVTYLKFGMFVTGISSGVRIWALEQYITPRPLADGQALELNRDRWILEVYRTIIESLQGLAWVLLVFFIFALIAFVIVRGMELRKQKA
jgi:hypothetical protein